MDMDLKTKIRQYIEAHTDEMVTDICDLCRIDSVRGEAAPGMPYGEGPHKALMAAAEAIAALISADDLSADYIVPRAFDKRVGEAVAKAVRSAAEASGAARK